MRVAIILGNRLKDDQSVSETLKERLELFCELDRAYHFDRIVLSGGLTNTVANISEALAMERELVGRGYLSDRLIKEELSMTTKENAKFSLPICLAMGAVEIIVISSVSHEARPFMKVTSIFEREKMKYSKACKIKYFFG